MELHHERSGGVEEKVLPQRAVGMAQLPGQQAQPRGPEFKESLDTALRHKVWISDGPV